MKTVVLRFTPSRVTPKEADSQAHLCTQRSEIARCTTASFVLIVLVAMAGHATAAPPTFTFQKIVDTNTPIPGGAGNFTSFLSTSLDGGNVAFWGRGSGGQQGIYTNIAGLAVVADRSTAIPGGTGNFSNFSPPSLDGGNVAFRGTGSGFQSGIYTDIGGLAAVADRNTPFPGGTGNFTGGFSFPSLNGGNVAFGAFGPFGLQGIYTDVGGLGVVADTNTPIPGATGNFTILDSPSLNGGNVAFRGIGSTFSKSGIYTDIGGLGVVADTKTLIPGGTGKFLGFATQSRALGGGNVAFWGRGSGGQEGIYTNIGGLGMLADTSTLIPGGTGNFTGFGFGHPSLDGGNVVIFGEGSGGQQGIYTNIGGSLSKVIDLTDPLLGNTLSFLRFDPEGLSGNSLTFFAQFTDGSRGIFTATTSVVPEPSSLVMLAMGAVGLLGYSWRRKRKRAA